MKLIPKQIPYLTGIEWLRSLYFEAADNYRWIYARKLRAVAAVAEAEYKLEALRARIALAEGIDPDQVQAICADRRAAQAAKRATEAEKVAKKRKEAR